MQIQEWRSLDLEREIGVQKSRMIEEVEGLQLWRLGRDRFEEFHDFIRRVYTEAFASDGQLPFTEQELRASNEEYFDRARLCAVIHPDGTLLGTWGLVLKERDDDTSLPIQKIFGLPIDEILTKLESPQARYLFNGWRTAVDKQALEKHKLAANKSILIFDLLLRGLTDDFADADRFVGVAEMELLVLRYHRRVGLPWITLGEPKTYWGKERFPCGFRLADFKRNLAERHPERYALVYGKGG